MKIRNGFISNSSSSSFIVAVDNKKSTKIKVTIEAEIDLADYSDVLVDSKEKLIEYLDVEYGVDEEFYAKDRCLEAIDRGKTVIFGCFSDDGGDETEALLCSKGIRNVLTTPSVEVIEGDGGY